MKPTRPNLEIVRNSPVGNAEKLRAIESDISYKGSLGDLLERAYQYADPLLSESSEAASGRVIANFQTPRREITAGDGSKLWLEFFLYIPPLTYEASIIAKWYEAGDNGQLRLLENLSVKHMEPGTAAYIEDNTRLLNLICESLDAFEAGALIAHPEF